MVYNCLELKWTLKLQREDRLPLSWQEVRQTNDATVSFTSVLTSTPNLYRD